MSFNQKFERNQKKERKKIFTLHKSGIWKRKSIRDLLVELLSKLKTCALLPSGAKQWNNSTEAPNNDYGHCYHFSST